MIRSRRAFTLIELIISVTLLIVAISIALFATIGVNGLIQRSDARGVISEAGRTLSDELHRAVSNAPVGGVSPIKQYSGSTAYAGIQVKGFSAAESTNTCVVIGRANVTTTADSADTYTIDTAGTVAAVLIYRVDAAGLCPQTSSPLYQNRLTSSQSVVKDMRFSIQTVDCVPATPPGCVSKQLLRYVMTVQLAQKVTGTSGEARNPTLTLQGGLPIGLVNEAALALVIDTSTISHMVINCPFSQQLVASGGSGSGYSWSYNAFPPHPAWLSLSATGVLSGTPTAAGGPFTFSVKVVDNANHTASRTFSFNVSPSGACLGGGGSIE